jgi:integrase
LKEAVLSPSTIRGYKQIRNEYLESIMSTTFKSLTNEKIQLAINKEIKTRNLSTKTLKNITGLLASALKEYYPDFQFNVSLPQKRKYESHIPTIQEVNKILQETVNTDLYIPIMLSVCLGLRRSEICALEWKDIDYENKAIKISKAKVLNNEDGWEIKNPKSYAGNRILPAPDILLYALKKENKSKGYIISISPTVLSHRFIRLVKNLGLQHFRFHDLRHFNASVMLSLNIPDKYAMERMGHSTPNMLKSVYQHTFSDKKEEINHMINNYLETNMQHIMQHDN